MVQVGQKAPDVLLQTLDSRFQSLSAYWGNGRSALLLFLRHLG